MTNQWNPAAYDAKHAFVYEKAKGLVELLAPKAGERILDLGCGTGALTAEIAARGAEVLGVDRSAEMIGQARKKFPALRFEVMDARQLRFGTDVAQDDTARGEKQIPPDRSRDSQNSLVTAIPPPIAGAGIPFDVAPYEAILEARDRSRLRAKEQNHDSEEGAEKTKSRSLSPIRTNHSWVQDDSLEGFDAVFSNAVLHWIPEADDVIAGVARVLKPGGRFVAEFGGKGNIQTLVAGFHKALAALDLRPPEPVGPWFYPSVAEYAGMLERHGLEVREASLFDRPTVLEEGERGLENWIRVFRNSFVEKMGEADAARWIREVERLCRSDLFRDGSWVLDYRRLRIAAWKK
ncbi:MAG TPA: methyltransferase domain-containing protein [Candidatus Acidoferrum sp.]|nr:methyltransferase domain-containing protein [Candidatus Acidoferrum sp.]